MPNGPLVRSNKATIAGIRSDFINTYKKTEPEALKFMKQVMDFVSVDERYPRYYYRKSPPLPGLWYDGEAVPTEGMDEQSYSLLIRSWAVHIPWLRIDREDDLTKTLKSSAQQAGAGFAKLAMEIFFQIALGVSNTRLLPSIPLAPDGAALASELDGAGDPRFGAASGNKFAGSGVESENDIRRDFWRVMGEGFRAFKHTDLVTPIFEESELNHALVIFDPKNERVFREAFMQTMQAQPVGGSAASVSNIILESGMKITLWSSSYMAGSDKWFVTLPGAHILPLVRAEKEGLRSVEYGDSNSDISRLHGQEGLVMWQRAGYAVNLPLAFCEVTN